MYTWLVPLLLIVLALLAPAQEAPRNQPGSARPLPAEIPIFPLPDTVLFPDVSRPFHVFEPRYREMIADALTGNRIVGMVRLRPGFEKDYDGRPPIYEIGCAGVIDEYEQLPDGGYVILLRGITTFRVLGEDQRKPYRIARIEARPEVLRDGDLAPLSAIRTRVERLLSTLLPFGVEPPDPGLDDAEFVNVVAQNLEMPESTRQDLLERNGVLARARALAALMER
jgi:Lon protease-like protein